MRANAYLNFNGQCEEAFNFYADALGGTIKLMMRSEGTPAAAHMPANWGPKIIHAEMMLGDSVLMGADSPPERYNPAKGFAVSLIVDTVAEAERVFTALSEGGTVNMPLQQTFFAVRFGMVNDRFGTPWMVNCDNG